ncbi:hypothetical protein GCM10010295_09770 [Streptomyces intermedius]|uniref:Uncharacterized protein n=1 Tax=Streptomyces koyangensis TaxID=188770 RepID=A0A385DE72_9ACTN|nr:hypothetical protein D0C37_20725 [Streptomyces koyangensis]PKR46611.1 hypothetical protein CWE27_03300 [Streptomyces sp. EAG2]
MSPPPTGQYGYPPATPSRASGAFGQVIMQLLCKEPESRPVRGEIRQTLTALARPAAAPVTRPRRSPDLRPGPDAGPSASS